MSLLNDERDNYIFGGLAAKAGKILPRMYEGLVKDLVKLSNVGRYANSYQNNTRYFSPLNNTRELLRRKKQDRNERRRSLNVKTRLHRHRRWR